MSKKFTWARGQQSALAAACDISCSYLCDLLHRRKRASPEIAATIEREAKRMEIPITRLDLLYPEDSTSQAFRS